MRLPNSVVHVALDALGKNGPDRQVGLSLTPITVSTTGLSGITEPTAPSYARVNLPASAWPEAADRAIVADQVAFPDPTEDWGVITHYFLTDAAGVPELPVKIQGVLVEAGAHALHVTPRITSPL